MDFINKKCLKSSDPQGNDVFTCNFELSFELGTITQASFRFDVTVTIAAFSTSVLSFDVIPGEDLIIADPICSNGKCLSVVDSLLKYCKNATCEEISDLPFTSLFVNQYFWIIHKISDSSFKNWKLSPKSIKVTA